jgi:hypothetical protein
MDLLPYEDYCTQLCYNMLHMLFVRRYPQMMQALMARFHGHPYDTMDLLPYNVVDPVKKTPLENLWAMGHNRNELVSVI